jgi:hypothetical protein
VTVEAVIRNKFIVENDYNRKYKVSLEWFLINNLSQESTKFIHEEPYSILGSVIGIPSQHQYQLSHMSKCTSRAFLSQ